jgi:hypothetical protein
MDRRWAWYEDRKRYIMRVMGLRFGIIISINHLHLSINHLN